MLVFNGVNIFANEMIPIDRIVQFDKGVMMNPYSIGNLILNDLKKEYIDVFSCIGANRHSIDVCADFAKRKVQNFIDNF